MATQRVLLVLGIAGGLAVGLGGCGFRPLYKLLPADAAPADRAVTADLASINVATIPNRQGQDLRNRLQDMLHMPGAGGSPGKYVLYVGLGEFQQSLAVRQTGLATRANLYMNATYNMVDTTTGGSVLTGSSVGIASYDLLDQDFATLTAINDARTRVIDRIADNIRNRLAVHFSSGPAVAAVPAAVQPSPAVPAATSPAQPPPTPPGTPPVVLVPSPATEPTIASPAGTPIDLPPGESWWCDLGGITLKLSPAKWASFVRRPDPAIGAVLIFGPDRGLVRERSDALARAVLGDDLDPFRLIEMTAAGVRADPTALVDAARSFPLVPGRRLIRVRDAGEPVVEAIRLLVAARQWDALVVCEAGDLGKRSALRAAFEAPAGVAAVACFADEGDGLRCRDRGKSRRLRPPGNRRRRRSAQRRPRRRSRPQPPRAREAGPLLRRRQRRRRRRCGRGCRHRSPRVADDDSHAGGGG